jgi:hypothetical protein
MEMLVPLVEVDRRAIPPGRQEQGGMRGTVSIDGISAIHEVN